MKKGFKKMWENLFAFGVFVLGVLMMVLAIAQFIRNSDDDAFGARRKANELQGEMVTKTQYMKEVGETNQWIARVDNDRVADSHRTDALETRMKELERRFAPTEEKVAELIRRQADRVKAEEAVFAHLSRIEKRIVTAKPTPIPSRIQVDVLHSTKYPDDVYPDNVQSKTKKKK